MDAGFGSNVTSQTHSLDLSWLGLSMLDYDCQLLTWTQPEGFKISWERHTEPIVEVFGGSFGLLLLEINKDDSGRSTNMTSASLSHFWTFADILASGSQ